MHLFGDVGNSCVALLECDPDGSSGAVDDRRIRGRVLALDPCPPVDLLESEFKGCPIPPGELAFPSATQPRARSRRSR
jgi:hypothetical protein